MTEPLPLTHTQSLVETYTVALGDSPTVDAMRRAAYELRARRCELVVPAPPGVTLQFELSLQHFEVYCEAVCRTSLLVIAYLLDDRGRWTLDGIPVVPMGPADFQGNRLVWRQTTVKAMDMREI